MKSENRSANEQTGSLLLADDEVGSRADFFEASAVPKNAVDEILAHGVAAGEENLETVARPFALGGEKIRDVQRHAPLGARFVEKQVGPETGFSIFERVAWGFQERAGNEQQVRIDGIDANRGCRVGVEIRATQIESGQHLRSAAVVSNPEEGV